MLAWHFYYGVEAPKSARLSVSLVTSKIGRRAAALLAGGGIVHDTASAMLMLPHIGLSHAARPIIVATGLSMAPKLLIIWRVKVAANIEVSGLGLAVIYHAIVTKWRNQEAKRNKISIAHFNHHRVNNHAGENHARGNLLAIGVAT